MLRLYPKRLKSSAHTPQISSCPYLEIYDICKDTETWISGGLIFSNQNRIILIQCLFGSRISKISRVVLQLWILRAQADVQTVSWTAMCCQSGCLWHTMLSPQHASSCLTTTEWLWQNALNANTTSVRFVGFTRLLQFRIFRLSFVIVAPCSLIYVVIYCALSGIRGTYKREQNYLFVYKCQSKQNLI